MTGANNNEIRILTPSGMLGYGFRVGHFKRGLARQPHAITIDSGSTDSEPQKLGKGEMTCSREAYVKDIEVLLEAQHAARIPVLISSAGSDGSNLHVDAFRDIIAEIAQRRSGHFKLASIYADIDKALVSKELKAGSAVAGLAHAGLKLDQAVRTATSWIVSWPGCRPPGVWAASVQASADPARASRPPAP